MRQAYFAVEVLHAKRRSWGSQFRLCGSRCHFASTAWCSWSSSGSEAVSQGSAVLGDKQSDPDTVASEHTPPPRHNMFLWFMSLPEWRGLWFSCKEILDCLSLNNWAG